MLDVRLDPKSVDATVDYLQAVKDKIFAAVRAGMTEAMQLLAENTVEAMRGAGIQARTGQLEENVLKSPHISEDENVIRGRVYAGSTVKAKGGARYAFNLGNVLDIGAIEPEVVETGPFQFTTADGDTIFRRGHKAFDIKPHPFFRRAVEVSESPIMEIIRRRVAEAVEE